ncbi:phospholipid scramblase 2-like [Aricia agestis]|uniref:phospholipid scramblase 2-like n=1 Tax=Aricia agestis TaxID=91739 RepID=UPI001C209C33|nr:phospholipid scramblase 2-like [Aricia agestis]
METTEPSEDLTRLEALDRVVIRERSTGCKNCKYVVLSPDGQELLYATEDSGIVSKLLAGQSRALEIDLLDTKQRVVIKLRRPYAVGGDKMEVSVRGAAAAVVRREATLLKPVLRVTDARDETLLRVKGPVSISSSCDFHLYSVSKQRMGVIRKRWSGSGDHDNFIIVFPPTATLHTKAAIVATALLIDFLFYL